MTRLMVEDIGGITISLAFDIGGNNIGVGISVDAGLGAQGDQWKM